MSNFSKYATAYRLALSRALVYRANLFLGAINVLIWFGTLILLYRAIGGTIGSYSSHELVTYILLTSFLTAVLFNDTSEQIANEIFEGDLASFLLRPINYFYYWMARSAATRSVLFLIAIVVVSILSRFVANDVIIQSNPIVLLQTATLVVGSLVLMMILDFIGATFSFWTGRSFGPRWLLMICSRFLSGAALPIALMPMWAQTIFYATPFPSIVSAPVESYLGHQRGMAFIHALVVQWIWIVILLILLWCLWKRGVKTYAAYGN